MLLVAAFTKEAMVSSGHMIIVVLILAWPLYMPGGDSELALTHVEACGGCPFWVHPQGLC